MEKSNKKAPIIFYIRLILLFVWLTSVCLVGRIYARYSSSTSGTGNALVAGFNVSVAMVDDPGDPKTIDLTSATEAQSVSWSFTVTNDSEVAAVDTVTVRLRDPLPVGVTVSMELEGHGAVALTRSETDDKIYTCSADIGFNETHTWKLIFTGDPDEVASEDTLGISIDVNVEQKD